MKAALRPESWENMKRRHFLTAVGQRVAPAFGAERFKKLEYTNLGNALDVALQRLPREARLPATTIQESL